MVAPKTKKKPAKKKPARKPAKPRQPFAGKPLPAGDIQLLLKELRHGAPDVMLANGAGLAVTIRGVVSTQCDGIDDAIGRGGVPLGRLTILHGPEGCGKTTLALHICAEVQRIGGVALFLDKEYKLDMEYAAKLGIDKSRLFLRQPDTLEEAFTFMEDVIEKVAAMRERLGIRIPVIIVLDSMNAAITKAMLEGEHGDHHIAPQARMYSQGLPKLMPKVYKDDVGLVWISQVRKKMNISFGNDEDIAGGNAPRFYASLIMHIKKIGTVKKNDEASGNITVCKVTKNQVAPPFKKSTFVIKYGVGIDNERSLLELGLKSGVVDKSGAWYSFDGERIGNGLDNSSAFLKGHPELVVKIREAHHAAKAAKAAKAEAKAKAPLPAVEDDDDDEDEE